MYLSKDDCAVIYARMCHAWYGRKAKHVVKKRISELRKIGDRDGMDAWTLVQGKLSQLQAHRPSSAYGKLY